MDPMEDPAAILRTSFTEFPYEPYSIQQGFMEALYEVLERGQLGLFESPTGTGKTISLICGALHWLEDHRQRVLLEQESQQQQQKQGQRQPREQAGAEGEDPEWLLAGEGQQQTAAPEAHPWRRRRQQRQAGPQEVAVAGLGSQARAGGAASMAQTRRLAGTTGTAPSASAAAAAAASLDMPPAARKPEAAADDEFLLPDPRVSAGDEAGPGPGSCGAGAALLRPRNAAADSSDSSGDEGEASLERQALRALRTPPPAPSKVQVLFASRTHSQLAQFVVELRRTSFVSRLSVVSLAGRRGLCVHEPVASLGAAHLINDRCAELQESRAGCKAPRAQQGPPAAAGRAPAGVQQRQRRGAAGGGGGCRCPFLSPGLEAAEGFAEAVLSAPHDVEDLGRLGRKLGICPYYGSRSLLAEADVVALPYSALLSEETRGSLGIRLERSVVIFDEAHNLLDAVNASHSAAVTLLQLQAASRQLGAYLKCFSTRLAPANARNVQLLMKALALLQRGLEPAVPAPAVAAPGAGRVVSPLDFLIDMRMDHLHLLPLLRWVRESRLVMKVAGYERSAASAAAPGAPGAAGTAAGDDAPTADTTAAAAAAPAGRAALFACVSFLSCLTHADADGRIIVTPSPSPPPASFATASARPAPGNTASAAPSLEEPGLKYVLLDAAARFARILAAARSVVLASGTLAPADALAAQLFPSCPLQRLRKYSCGHVVPPEQVLAVVAARGPSGLDLDLRHGQRASPEMMDEVGRALVNICQAVPAGVVVFAPSFGYLATLVARWQAGSTWASLQARKQVYLEPRASTEVERVLTAYAAAVRRFGEAAAGAQQGGGGARQPTGALLLCVIGGKLSEGINFGDDLGRCVVVLGLPYPNPSDPELQERMRYLDAAAATAAMAAQAAAGGRGSSAVGVGVQGAAGMDAATVQLTGRQYYEGLCIKAVNQTVGRVIRHINDYAAIVLMDMRYASAGGAAGQAPTGAGMHAHARPGSGALTSQLPSWLQESLVCDRAEFGKVYAHLHAFFRARVLPPSIAKQ